MNKPAVEQVKAKIREWIANEVGLAPCEIADGSTLDNMGLDIMDITELEEALETEYGIAIWDEIEPDMTLEKAAEEIAELVAAKAAERNSDRQDGGAK